MRRAHLRLLLLYLLVPGLAAPACQQTAPPGADSPAAAAPTPAPAGAEEATGAAKDLATRFPAGKNCSVEAVQAAVQPHKDSVTACYRAGLGRNPDLAGTLKVQLVVSEIGRAHAVQVVEDKLGDPSVGACVTGVLETLSYAPSPAGRPCTIVYPFDFQTSPEVRQQLRGGQP